MSDVSTEDDSASSDAPKLRRSIGPAQMALYGLGSMLGAGIYGLIGKAAGQAGNAVWLAFLVALVAALLTALSYASLGSRYPRAAGAAYVTERAYGFPLLSFMVGLALVCSGLTSIATQSQVFAANIAALVRHREPAGVAARARLPADPDRHRISRHPRVDVGQCAVHAGRGGRPGARDRGRHVLLGLGRLFRDAGRARRRPCYPAGHARRRARLLRLYRLRGHVQRGGGGARARAHAAARPDPRHGCGRSAPLYRRCDHRRLGRAVERTRATRRDPSPR